RRMTRGRDLFHSLPECASSPHDVENFCLIPVNLHCARPNKISRRVQVHKLCFHVFSLFVWRGHSCPRAFEFCRRGRPARVFPSAPFRMYLHQPSQVQKQRHSPRLCLSPQNSTFPCQLLNHPGPRHLRFHRDSLLNAERLQSLVQNRRVHSFIFIPILRQQAARQWRKRLSRQPGSLCLQLSVGFFQRRQPLLQFVRAVVFR